jgi:predicted transcriptional regulator
MSHRLQVLIPEELAMRLQKAAQRCRVSKGEWVRRAIETALSQPPSPGNSRATDPLTRLTSLNGPTAEIGQMLAEIEAGRR